MRAARQTGTVTFSAQGSLLPSQIHVASRSSWFVPLMGVVVYIFAIIDSSVEGCNIALYFDSMVGLALISYRLWPPLSTRRVSILVGLSILEALVLAAHIASLVINSDALRTWFGDSNVTGVVLDSLVLALLLLIASDKIPAILHNPSTIRFWRVPLGYQMCWFLISSCLASLFNPSIFITPYFIVVLWSFYELASGKRLEECLISSKKFPKSFLAYSCMYGTIGFALALPVVANAVKGISWLAVALGVPEQGNHTYNYSCVMPAGISLLCSVIMAPWWSEVGVLKRVGRPSQLFRSSTRGSQAEAPHSPHRNRRLASVVSSIAQDSEDGAIVQEALRLVEEKRLAAERREKLLLKYFRLFQVIVVGIVFPLCLIIIPLLLPSSLGIPLICLGVGLVGSPKFFNRSGFFLQLYLALFFVGVYVSSIVVDAIVPDPAVESTLFSVGLLARDFFGNIWDRFLLLLALSGLLVLCTIVNRVRALQPRRASSNTSVDEPLALLDEEHTISPIPAEQVSTWKLCLEGLVGLLQSAEFGFGLVISIVFIQAAIEKQTSCISVLYLIVLLPSLWVQKSERFFFSTTILVIAGLFISILMGYAAWLGTSTPQAWLTDLGFSAPSPSDCFVAALPHIFIALSGSLFLRLHAQSTHNAESKFVDFFSKFPILSARLALLIAMILSLVLFVMMPFDYFSAIVIVCFVVQMALLQQGLEKDFSIDSVILQVYVVQLFVLTATLVWVIVSMIPAMYTQIVTSLENNAYIQPSELAVLPDCEYLGKLSVMASLLVWSSFLIKHRSFIEHSTLTSANELVHLPQKHPVLARLLVIVSGQLPRLLIFVIFLASVYQTTFLNVATELIVCFFLIVGYGWKQVGFFFSILSMFLLFLQYMSSFSIVTDLVNPALLDYLGMYWSSISVARNMCIFMACIVQRNVQQFVRVITSEAHDIYFDSLDKYAQVIIATFLIMGATGRGNFFSVIYLLMGTAFVIRQSITDRRLSTWSLRLVAIIVGICLAAQQLIRLWFPTVCDWCRQRPDVSMFCPSDLSGNDIVACIDDWQRYFNVPSSMSGSTVLMDNATARDSLAVALGFSLPYSVAPMPATGIVWDFAILWVVCVLVQNHLLRMHAKSSISTDTIVHSMRSRRRKFFNSLIKFLAQYWIGIVEILAILSSFSFRKTVDGFSIMFMTFTFVLFWAQEKRLSIRRRTVVGGIVVGLIVVILTIAYQVPIFMCKYWSNDLLLTITGPTGNRGGPATGWSIPTIMCMSLQRSMAGMENFGAFKWNEIGIQMVGLMKADYRFTATPFPMTIGPCILLLAALLVQLALYDHSTSYRHIDENLFNKEFKLRQVRARRFVCEFNANLLIRNRKVSHALEATRRQLIRVQKSAEILLGIFYSRLAGSSTGGELIRSQTDHLSSETESVCVRGYSMEEAELALSLTRDQPDGTALLLLERAREFALNGAQETDVVIECKKLLLVQDEQQIIKTKESWSQRIRNWMSYLNNKCSLWLSRQIDDIVFVSNGSEPLCLHRKFDSIFLLFWKALFTNSQIFVVFFSVLAFVATNSVFDVIRVAIVLLAMPVYPFANRNVWRLLLIYTCVGIFIKAVFQLPLFCAAGIDGNNAFASPLYRLSSEARTSTNYIIGCKKPSIVGWDIVVGMPKMFGSSALSNMSTSDILFVIWQDILVLMALFWYRSFLHKAGVWDHLTVASLGTDSGAIIVPRGEKKKMMSEILLSEESRVDVAAVDEMEEEEIVENGIDDYTDQDSIDQSPVGSFIDIDCKSLDSLDRDTLSRYAVQRYMGSEDVVNRIEACKRDTNTILGILNIYKKVRWDAQFVYSNKECVRMFREDRDMINTVTQSGLSLLSRMSSLYVKINPFYQVKVGQDYYVIFFVFGLMMFFHVVFFYSKMTNESNSDFVSSLQRSQFSSGLALLMLFHFVLLILDRAYYVASFRRSAENTARRTGFRPPPKQQVFWFFIRLVLLLTITITLHAVIMNSLFKRGSSYYSPLIQNSALAVYYLEFAVYLIFSGLQIKEGFPRLMKEALRPAKTYDTVLDKFQEIRFLVFRAIPFLDELRILIDWTVSPSCLDLFQYFKLEDAHTYLWQTGREMEVRKKMWPAEPIGKAEKSFMGFGFLLLLMIIIIGPVLLFSTLVSPGIVAPLSNAALTVSLVIQTCPKCTQWWEGAPVSTSSMVLYSSTPSVISSLSWEEQNLYFPTGRSNIDKDSSVERIDFEKESQVPLILNNERFKFFNNATAQAVYIKIETALTFERMTETGGYVGPPTTIRMPSCACKPGFEHLCTSCTNIPANETANAFASMFAAANSLIDPLDTSLVLVPGALSELVRIDGAGTVIDTSLVQYANKSLALAIVNATGYVAVWDNTCGLKYAGICNQANKTEVDIDGSDPSFSFILAPVLPSTDTGGALLSIGIVTVYITIVYAIGRFLRLVFDKESLRVIYLEIPRPDDLVDLATGAAIARHYKDLPMEFKLYNCLIKIMRSPETLIALGGADLTGYGARRTDDPPYPDLLCDEDKERIKRRRRKNRSKK